MHVVVIEAPGPLVELELAKQHLRVDGGDSDSLISAYIAAISAHIDGPEGWLGRSVGNQLLELRTDTLCGLIVLPYGPAAAIEAITYIDPDGASVTLPPVSYVLDGDSVDLAYGKAWPRVRGDRGGVRIRYRAGYESCPRPIEIAALLLLGELYDRREDSSAEIKIDGPAAALLNPYRCWWP